MSGACVVGDAVSCGNVSASFSRTGSFILSLTEIGERLFLSPAGSPRNRLVSQVGTSYTWDSQLEARRSRKLYLERNVPSRSLCLEGTGGGCGE